MLQLTAESKFADLDVGIGKFQYPTLHINLDTPTSRCQFLCQSNRKQIPNSSIKGIPGRLQGSLQNADNAEQPGRIAAKAEQVSGQ
jgi:hypothetical protein